MLCQCSGKAPWSYRVGFRLLLTATDGNTAHPMDTYIYHTGLMLKLAAVNASNINTDELVHVACMYVDVRPISN